MKSLRFIFLILAALCSSCNQKVNCDDVIFISTEGGDNCDLSLEIGRCLQKKGKYEFALINYLASAKNCDTTSFLMANISDCYYKLNKDSLAESFALIAIRYDKLNITARYNLAVIYFNREEFEKALQIVNETTGLEEDAEFSFLAFEICWANDETIQARKFIENAIRLDNKNDEYKSRYAALLGSLNEYDSAIEISLEIYERNQDTSYYFFSLSRMLGMLYLNSGDTITACSYFEKLKNRKEFYEIYLEEIQNCVQKK
jgi:tetratricopeptide (TPR) repeat protein